MTFPGVVAGDHGQLPGQTVEHVWPEELAGFLSEANRVLGPQGWIVLDSPNRRITQS